MAEPLRVEAPSEDLAHALMTRLHSYPAELRAENGRIEVRVLLTGHADRAIVEVLDGVDAWLVEHELESVRVLLDDRAYTLAPPSLVAR